MLVAPVFTKGAATRDVYLPDGDWYDWWTGKSQPAARRHPHGRPGDHADLRPRGAIIPFDPSAVHDAARRRADHDPRLCRRRRPVSLVRGRRRHRRTTYDGKFAWTNLKWDDAARRLQRSSRDTIRRNTRPPAPSSWWIAPRRPDRPDRLSTVAGAECVVLYPGAFAIV